MEKNKSKFSTTLIILSILTVIIFAVIFAITSSTGTYNEGIIISKQKQNEIVAQWEINNIYGAYVNGTLYKSFDNLEDAIFYASMYEDSYIIEKENSETVWHNIPKYHLYSEDRLVKKFHSYSEAQKLAQEYNKAYLYSIDRNTDNTEDKGLLVWSNNVEVKESLILEVPFVRQMPELIRGCEVTSLSMLLKYIGIDADKMILAQQIDKDNTPYKIVDNTIYYGDPSVGFIGSMSDGTKPGYGANHAPIFKLLEKYVKIRAIDLTGADFDSIYFFLNQNSPVWVITNTDLKKLNENEFYTWLTPSGKTIRATNKEHSVLITGYDNDYIYINDPLAVQPNKKVIKNDFIQAWEQMGKQAVTYIP